MELYFILVLQIVNLFVSSCAPIVSNFTQTITSSDCIGIHLKRKVTNKLSKSNKEIEIKEAKIDIPE